VAGDKIHILIVGADKRGRLLTEFFNKTKKMNILGIVDINARAPGIKLAKDLGIPTSTTYKKFIDKKELDEIINVTGSEEVQEELSRLKPVNVEVIGRQGTQLICDIAEECKRKEEMMQDEKKRFANIADSSLEWIWEIDVHGKYTYVSPGVEKILGYTSEDVLGKHFYDFFPPEDIEGLKKTASEVFSSKLSFRELTSRKMRKDGSIVWLSTRGDPIFDKKRTFLGYRGADLNITESKKAEEALENIEHSYKTLAENLPGIVYRVFIRENARVTLFNKMGREITGYKEEELKEGEVCAMESKILQEDRPNVVAKVMRAIFNRVPFTVEYRFIRKDGSIRYFLEKGTPLYGKDGNPLYIDGVIFDITDYKQAEMELKRLAVIDKLTGVFNRTKFKELIEREIGRALRYNKPLSMIMFDIDNFKNVNDTYGHSAGDYVLKTLAKIVRQAVRKIDYLIRWGGEEFLIILPENDLEKAHALAERIRKIIESYTFGNVGKITVSLGVAEFKGGETEETLIKNADDAMLKAKAKGRNRVEVSA
jgi:diguanylate cyclase (GGDEF)-like protein/PAS domain S-box-containing protein